MKKIVSVLVLAILFASSAQAGQIFGSLKEGGRPLVNAYFEVVMCKDNEKAVYKGTTDSYGAYSINVGRGKCTFKLYHRKLILEFGLYSYDRALRYDLNVVELNGVYTLKRN